MDNPQFNVVVDGTVLDGFETAEVLLQLQQHLKLPEAKATLLIAGKSVTVKRAVDAAVATTFCNRLRALGVNAQVKAVAEPIAAASSVAAENASVKVAPSSQPSTPRYRTQHYFSNSALTAKDTRNSSAFNRAVLRASIACINTLSAYGLLTLFGVGLFLYYLISHAYLLVAPPIVFSATVYIVVSVVLAFIAALLLRPFLPLQRETLTEHLLSPIQDPALFAFTSQLCEQLARKPPEEIVLTTATTHATSLVPGFKNLKAGNYRLTLSLPALENSTLNQFAGLLAADLATQAKPSMLRYRWLANHLSKRFDACTTNQDWLGQRIAMLAQAAPPKLASPLRFLGKVFEFANQYLQKFSAHIQRIDEKLQRPLLEEQDRYCALVSGSNDFSDLMIFHARLKLAAEHANAKNLEDRIDGGLVDDLPALIKHYYEGSDENFPRTLQRKWEAETTPRRNEPPIMRERIEHVVNAAKTGIINDEQSTLCLLQQRDESSRRTTLDHYRNKRLSFDADQLLPVDKLTYAATQDILQRQQAEIYFNGWFKPFRFWSLADYQLIRDMPLQDAAMQLSVCVNEIRRLTPDRAKLLAEYERLQNQLREILIAQHVLAAGKKFSFRYINYDGTTLTPVLEDRQREIGIVTDKLLQQEVVMGGRITLGLRLSGQDEREVVELHDTLRMLHDIGARLHKLSLDCIQLEQLLQRQQMREADYTLPIKKIETKINDASTLLIMRLSDIPYPLEGRHHSMKSFVESALSQPAAKHHSPTLQRVLRLIDILYHVNEKLSRQAADYGAIAEEAYRIEPIRLIPSD